jgi:hypothetical protein
MHERWKKSLRIKLNCAIQRCTPGMTSLVSLLSEVRSEHPGADDILEENLNCPCHPRVGLDTRGAGANIGGMGVWGAGKTEIN